MRHTNENVLVKTTLAPITKTTGAATSTAVDTLGYGDGVAVISVGAATGAPDSFAVNAKLQESVDAAFTSPVDIAGAAITAITTAGKTAEIPFTRQQRAASLRYIRALVTPTFVGGSSPAIGIGATIVLGNPERGATANSLTGN